MLAIIENKWNVKYFQILTATKEDPTENIEEGVNWKFFIT